MSKEILLTKGQLALVDDEDFERLSIYSYYAQWDPDIKAFYAFRSETSDGKRRCIGLHRDVLAEQLKTNEVADHIDPSKTLDNRRCNLRVATKAQNSWNTRKRTDNLSGYRGVSWNCGDNKWSSRITANGKNRFLGNFLSPEEASLAYEQAAKEFHGSFTRI